MKEKLFLAWLLLTVLSASGQKPILDTAVFGKWPAVSNPQISDDGRYSLYYINGIGNLGELHIVNNHTLYAIKASNIRRDASFANKGRYVIYRNAGDTLCIYNLRKDKEVLYHVYGSGKFRTMIDGLATRRREPKKT